MTLREMNYESELALRDTANHTNKHEIKRNRSIAWDFALVLANHDVLDHLRQLSYTKGTP